MAKTKAKAAVTVDDLRVQRRAINDNIAALRAEAAELTAAFAAMESE